MINDEKGLTGVNSQTQENVNHGIDTLEGKADPLSPKVSPMKPEEAKAEMQSQVSKKSATQKSTRSLKSDKSDRTEHPRERF